MRVIAGKFRGRLLKMPKGVKIRPSSQKLKEALFSILGERICGTSFLELFAGSGSIGIEAKSRGVKLVVFVDNNRLCVKTIEENLRRLGIEYSYGLKSLDVKKRVSARLLPFDAEEAIEVLYQRSEKFDLVFLDPPYYQGKSCSLAVQRRDKLKNCLIKICHYDILKTRSLVIAEHNKRQILPHSVLKLKLLFSKSYGDTALSFYQKEGKK